MNEEATTTFIVIPKQEWELIKTSQQEILTWFKEQKKKKQSPGAGYVTAIEYMNAVRISRSKFDELIAAGKIRVIRKKRKIYVPVGEIERYFSDPSIE